MRPAGVSSILCNNTQWVLGVYVLLLINQQFWCWIGNGSKYNVERLAGEYVWMWIALAVSLLTYIPLVWKCWALGIRLLSYVRFSKIQRRTYSPPFPKLSHRILHTRHAHQHRPLGRRLPETAPLSSSPRHRMHIQLIWARQRPDLLPHAPRSLWEGPLLVDQSTRSLRAGAYCYRRCSSATIGPPTNPGCSYGGSARSTCRGNRRAGGADEMGKG